MTAHIEMPSDTELMNVAVSRASQFIQDDLMPFGHALMMLGSLVSKEDQKRYTAEFGSRYMSALIYVLRFTRWDIGVRQGEGTFNQFDDTAKTCTHCGTVSYEGERTSDPRTGM